MGNNVLKERERQSRKAIMDNAFSGKIKFIGDKVILGTDKDKYTMNEVEFFNLLTEIVQDIYEYYIRGILSDRYSEDKTYTPARISTEEELDYNGKFFDYSSRPISAAFSVPVVYMVKALQLAQSSAKKGSSKLICDKFTKGIFGIWNNDIKPKFEIDDLYEILAHAIDGRLEDIVFSDEDNKDLQEKELKKSRKDVTLDFDGKILALKGLLTNQEFDDAKDLYIKTIATNERLLKAFLKDGIITDKDIVDCMTQEQLLNYALNYKNQTLLKYLDIKSKILAYNMGMISEKELASSDIKELLLTGMLQYSEKELLDLVFKIKKYADPEHLQEALWELFERDFLTVESMKLLVQKNIVKLDLQVSKYNEERARKIKAELKSEIISEEKMAELFDAEAIMSIIENNNSPKELVDFVKGKLKELYLVANKSYDQSIIQYEEDRSKQEGKDKPGYIDLYKQGIVELKSFKKDQIDEDDLLEYYLDTDNLQVLADGYNSGYFDGKYLVSILENPTNSKDDIIGIICGMIKNNKLDPNILTSGILDDSSKSLEEQILMLCVKGNLEISDIKSVKLDVDVIRDLYVQTKLPLVLLEKLVKENIITDIQTKKIKEAYDIKEAYKKLVKKGYIEGLLDVETKRAQHPIITNGNSTTNNGGNKPIRRLSERITWTSRANFLMSLGADSNVLPVEGGLFKDYYMFALVDDGVAILEPENGREYSFIMPLRIILEQVDENAGDGLLATTHYKRLLMSETSVRTIAHVATYGANIIKAAGSISSDFKAKQLLKDPSCISSINKMNAEFKANKAKEII